MYTNRPICDYLDLYRTFIYFSVYQWNTFETNGTLRLYGYRLLQNVSILNDFRVFQTTSLLRSTGMLL